MIGAAKIGLLRRGVGGQRLRNPYKAGRLVHPSMRTCPSYGADAKYAAGSPPARSKRFGR